MRKFLGKDFLLGNQTAEKLYHDHAAKMPIIDYHCHLSPKDIAEDRIFGSITEAWLEGDHYKWRAMRTNGIDEKYVTGNASDADKFSKWGETVPYTLRNPLYHWTHLELKRYFDIDQLLNAQTASDIFQETSRQLAQPAYSTKGLLRKMNVQMVGTTDDPTDDLQFHKQLSGFEVKVLPTFRPDKMFGIDAPTYQEYLDKLGVVVGFEIADFDDLINSAQQRVDYFHTHGCRVSDHGLEQFYDAKFSLEEAKKIFLNFKANKSISQPEVQLFKMTVLSELSKMYHAKGWVQQFHVGAIRNNNTRMLSLLGPDTGFDSIGDFSQMKGMSQFLNFLEGTDQLCQTILYNLNPRDNDAFATMIGNFNAGTDIPGKIQFGSGWWFLDQKDGMEKQMNALSNMGLLSRFIGMLTDSRSFLSFPRHEYFRRILCNLLGADVEKGELPNDLSLLGEMVENICFNNAKAYFKF